jgi:hypothetical protein
MPSGGFLTRYSRGALGRGSAISKNGILDELMSIVLLGGRPPREAVEAPGADPAR